MFLVIDQRTKSERRGLPPVLMRIFDWEDGKSIDVKKRITSAHTWDCADNFIVVYVVKTASDPNQLHALQSTRSQI